MARDLKKLFEEERQLKLEKMPDGHEVRFMKKLDSEMPEQKSRSGFSYFKIAIAAVLVFGLGFLSKHLFFDQTEAPAEMVETKTLEDVSPQLKKVEDYYLANINQELANIDYTPENKELFDGYIKRLGELSEEYDKIAKELIELGPSEYAVSALIDNLKLRLNLLLRLKEKLNELNSEDVQKAVQG